MYSEENFFNFNKTNPSQWYNVTINRELIQFSFIEGKPNGDNTEPPIDLIFIILIIISFTGVVIGSTLFVRYMKQREPREKASKKPIKHNPKLTKR